MVRVRTQIVREPSYQFGVTFATAPTMPVEQAKQTRGLRWKVLHCYNNAPREPSFVEIMGTDQETTDLDL